MHFQHSGDIWRDFPALVPGVLYADGITSQADVEARVDRFAAAAKARLADGPEGELPEIQAWRRVFAQMGLKPTQYRCASESLLRRFRKEGSLPRLHPLVDLCNAVSLAFATPVAVFDAARVAWPLEVRYAVGDEDYLTFGGDTEHPAPGEVIFADQAGRAHARRWTNRQSGLSAVRGSTAAVLIVAEALHLQGASDVRELTATLAAELGAVWSVTPSAALLTPNEPGFTFGASAQLRQRRERQRPAASQPGVLGLLCRLRLAGPAPVASRHDGAPLVRGDCGGGRVEPDRAVVHAVRQDHQVGGEPVPADVRRLPDLPGMPLGERLRERPAEPRAADAALAVRADQEHRLGRRGPERRRRPGRELLQVTFGQVRCGRGHRTEPQPGLAARGPAGQDAAHVTHLAPARPADHLDPDAQRHGGGDQGP